MDLHSGGCGGGRWAYTGMLPGGFVVNGLFRDKVVASYTILLFNHNSYNNPVAHVFMWLMLDSTRRPDGVVAAQIALASAERSLQKRKSKTKHLSKNRNKSIKTATQVAPEPDDASTPDEQDVGGTMADAQQTVKKAKVSII